MTEAAPPVVEEVRFRPMDRSEEDLRLFLKCFNDNDLPRTIDLLRWQYLEPPAGPLLVDLAVVPDGSSLAAIYAVFPIAMRANGQRTLGVQSLNTLTDEAFRGKGLFSKLAKSLYARCVREGVGLVYGFPNGNSAHGLFNRLEWKPLDPMPLLLRPLRTGYVLRRLPVLRKLARALDFRLTSSRAPRLTDGWSFSTVTTLSPEFDAVWQSFAKTIGFAVERDSQYLNWRLRRPGEQYECIALMSKGRPIGLAITGVRRVNAEETVGKLMDVFYDPDVPAAGAALGREALRRLSAAGCAAVWAWNFPHSPNHRVLRRAGFINVPAKLEKTEAHVGARAFVPMNGIDDRANWYISLLDSDTE